MYCTKCGAKLADDAVFCTNCGAPCEAAPAPNPIPQPIEAAQPVAPEAPVYSEAPVFSQAPVAAEPPITAKKPSGGRGILLGLGCLLLAAVVAFGAWFLLRKNSADARLLQAAKNSVSELDGYLKELPNLRTVMENLEAIDPEKALHADVDYTVSAQGDLGGTVYETTSKIAVAFDLDGAAKKVLGSALYKVEYAHGSDAQTTEIPLSIYADESELRCASSFALEEDEYLTLPLKDLPAQWNASAFSKLSGITLPDDLELELNTQAGEADLEQMLRDRYGDDWEKFAKSVEVRKYDGASPFGTAGTTYALVWDRELLEKMADEAETIDDSPSLSSLTSGDLSAERVISMLEEVSEALSDYPLFYVENDKLTGLQISNEDEGATVTLRLLGTQNLWEHLTVTTQRSEDSDSYYRTETFDVTMGQNAGILRIDAAHKYVNVNGGEEQDDPTSILYNDADGSIRFLEDGEAQEDMFTVTLTPVDSGAHLRIESPTDEEVYTDGISPENTTINLIVSGKIAPITAPGSKAIELLKLSEDELEALFTRIGEKVEPLFGALLD